MRITGEEQKFYTINSLHTKAVAKNIIITIMRRYLI